MLHILHFFSCLRCTSEPRFIYIFYLDQLDDGLCSVTPYIKSVVQFSTSSAAWFVCVFFGGSSLSLSLSLSLSRVSLKYIYDNDKEENMTAIGIGM